MNNTTISTPTARRTRSLSTFGAQLPVCDRTDSWGRGSRPAMSDPSANVPVYNSIASPLAAASAHTGARAFGAKQAAPPRGVPR